MKERVTDASGRTWTYTDEDEPTPIHPLYLGVRCVMCDLPYEDRGFTRGIRGELSYHTYETPHKAFCSAKCGQRYRETNGGYP
jgi:hypothetical protein